MAQAEGEATCRFFEAQMDDAPAASGLPGHRPELEITGTLPMASRSRR